MQSPSWYDNFFIEQRSLASQIRRFILGILGLATPTHQNHYHIVIAGTTPEKIANLESILYDEWHIIDSYDHTLSIMNHNTVTITSIRCKHDFSTNKYMKTFRNVFRTANAFLYMIDANDITIKSQQILKDILASEYITADVPYLFIADDILNYDALSVTEICKTYNIENTCSDVAWLMVGCSLPRHSYSLLEGLAWLGRDLRSGHVNKKKQPERSFRHLYDQSFCDVAMITM
jgi:hypothetical protein